MQISLVLICDTGGLVKLHKSGVSSVQRLEPQPFQTVGPLVVVNAEKSLATLAYAMTSPEARM